MQLAPSTPRSVGGSALRVTFDEARTPRGRHDHNLLALDEALDALANEDPRKSQVVELRSFGGLSNEEIRRRA